MGADVWTTARTMPDGYDRPDRFVAADTSTTGGAQAVADRIAQEGALDVLVHVVGLALLLAPLLWIAHRERRIPADG